MECNWTTVGSEFDREQVELAIESNRENWDPIPVTMSMSAGIAIREAIAQLDIREATHVFEANNLAPFGFYGIRCRYSNGIAQVYLIDTGTKLTPVCSEFQQN